MASSLGPWHSNEASCRNSSREIMRTPRSLICSCWLKRSVLKWIVHGKRMAQFFTSAANRFQYLIGLAVGNRSDLVNGKSLNRVQDKGFAVRAACSLQCELHERDHFIGVRNFLWGCGSLISNGALGRHGFIRLMKLEAGLVTGPLLALAPQSLQVDIGLGL